MARWLVLVAIAGCYREPRPACGFVCGQGASCPGGYTCNAADNRCHLDGTSAQCDSYVDAAPPEGPDTTPPMAVMISPTGSNVPRDAVVEVMFNEPVVNIDSHSFRVLFVDNDVTGTLTTTPFTARFTPEEPFLGVVTIRATLNETPVTTSLITDLAGNQLAPFDWSFSTAADPTPLAVIVTTPMSGQNNVSIFTSIDVSFNKAIGSFQPTSIAVDQGVTGPVTALTIATIRLLPNVPLAAATTYTVTVATDIADTSGLHLAAPFVFSFTTM